MIHIENCIIGLAVCLIIALGLSPATAKTDPRLAIFLQQFENMSSRWLPLDDPNNPFHLYLDKPFEEGLDDHDKTEMFRLVLSGECSDLGRFAQKGFLELHPFLKPAFTKHDKKRQISFTLQSDFSGPRRHCYDLKQLKKLKLWRDVTEFAPIDMSYDLADKRRRASRNAPETHKDILIGILNSFGHNAFCKDYHLSIMTVLKGANKPGGMILTAEEELYLVERARRYGYFNIFEYVEAMEKVKAKFKTLKRFEKIRHAARATKFAKLKLAIPGYWQKVC